MTIFSRSLLPSTMLINNILTLFQVGEMSEAVDTDSGVHIILRTK